MSLWPERFAWLLAIVLLLPSSLFLLQVMLAFLSPRRTPHSGFGMSGILAPPALPHKAASSGPAGADGVVVALLVPAHNEAEGLAVTLAGFRSRMRAHDRLVVVADNCTDETASVARSAGAEVVERHDLTARGKSHALAAGMAYLRQNPPAQVLILDADCQIDPDFIATLSQECVRHNLPVQSLYLMQAPAGDTRPASCFAEFAWRIKNWVRPLGARALRMPCALNGSGMIFPWAQINAVRVDNGNLAEDYTLGLDLVRAGHAARFSEEAVVLSQFPTSLASRLGQRTRWEHGHLALTTQTAPALALEALTSGRWALLGAALDLMIPPLALLALFAGLVLPLIALLCLLGNTAMPLVLASACVVGLGLALLMAWLGWGRDVLPFALMLQIPAYALGKAGLYTGFVTAREREWKRTNRD